MTRHWDRECDVALIGSGAGSLCAAILLAESGLRPLLIEKSDQIGGATAYSGGIVWAPDNHRMRAKGLSDSREEALAYLAAICGERGDPAIAQRYVETVPRILAGLQDRTALRWVTYPGLPDYYAELPGGKPAGRYLLPHGDLVREALERAAETWPEMHRVRPAVHLGPRRNEWVWGRALIGCLWAKFLEHGTPCLLEHRAISLVRTEARVEGIICTDPAGRAISIRARTGVLLDTGGFEWNDTMTTRFVPGPRLHPQTPPTNEGDGHVMASEIGAALSLMDRTIGMPSICSDNEMNVDRPLYRILFQELALPHAILVNAQGRRFANETYFAAVAEAWAEQAADLTYPNLPCFLIFDEDYRSKYGPPAGLEHLAQHASLNALAHELGVDAAGLSSEVTDFNSTLATTGSDRLGRGQTAYQRIFGDPAAGPNPTLGPISSPPFYGLRIHPATSGHRGGVVIDKNARVLDVRGQAIPGLFACGTCAAGTLTGERYFTGTAIGHAIVFGTLAAEQMLSGGAQRLSETPGEPTSERGRNV